MTTLTPCYRYRATVTSVYDGDTLTADIDLGFGVRMKGVALRLRGLDAPELRRPTLEDGRAARDWLRSLVLGKTVVIETHRTGSYHRWLADLWALREDGSPVYVNAALVAAGHAVPWAGERLGSAP